MTKRETIRKSVRFEVFKRDNFTCQYCGVKAPDAVLHVDHINPVSKGGDSEIINLITSCQPCNLGKSDRLLSDSSSIERQRAQLEELNERREQLEMMLAWRDSLRELDSNVLEEVALRIEGLIGDFTINEVGMSHIRKWLKRFSVTEILDAADAASERHLLTLTPESVEAFFGAIPRIASTKRLPEHKQRLLYARGILRRRIYVNEAQVMGLMERAIEGGMDVEELIEYAKQVKNWTEFRSELEGAANG